MACHDDDDHDDDDGRDDCDYQLKNQLKVQQEIGA